MTKIKLGTLAKLLDPATYLDVYFVNGVGICAMRADDLLKTCKMSNQRNDLQVERISVMSIGVRGLNIYVSEPDNRE